jgi:RNA recognition motif-containing protein
MEASECKVFVGNLPFSVGYEELKELFSPFGEITDSTVVVNKFSGRSRGFGFVTFAKKESAEKAISEMNDKEVKGRNIKVSPAVPPREGDRMSGDGDRESEEEESFEKSEEPEKKERKPRAKK